MESVGAWGRHGVHRPSHLGLPAHQIHRPLKSFLQVTHHHQPSIPQPLATFVATHAQVKGKPTASASPYSASHPRKEACPSLLHFSRSSLSMLLPSHEYQHGSASLEVVLARSWAHEPSREARSRLRLKTRRAD